MSQTAFAEGEKNETSPTEQPERFDAHADQPRKNAVYELYSAEGFYIDSVGNEVPYSFYVPQINADSPDADAINTEIAESFGALAEEQYQKMEGRHSLWAWKIEWHAYWDGNQLFLLIQSEENGGFCDYAAYGYDFDKGCRITNSMILEQRGIDEEEYLTNLKEKVQLMYEDMYSELPKRIPEASRAYQEVLEKTLEWQSLEEPMFIDQFGEIETIVKIGSIAGAGWFYYLATPFCYG